MDKMIQIGRDTHQILKVDLSTHRSTINELAHVAVLCYYLNSDKYHNINEKKEMKYDSKRVSVWIKETTHKMLQEDAVKTGLSISRLADFSIQEHYKIVNRKRDY